MSTFKHNHNNQGLSTQLIHQDDASNHGFSSVATPVYRASSIHFANSAAQRSKIDVLGLDYSYGLHGNPTQFTLAQKLASIEDARHGLVVPSGLSAIALVAQAFLKTGDHWLIPDNAYNPVYQLAQHLKTDYQIDFSVYHASNIDTVHANIRPTTKLLWVEAPGSLTFETPDLAGLLALAKKHQWVTAVDNTWAAGIAFKPLAFGFDISVYALTKYQNGHGDVLMGALIADNTEIFAKLEHKNRLYGLGVSPDDCAMVLRGLLTLPLRFTHQGMVGLKLAERLSTHPHVGRVLHPALPTGIGQAFFKQFFSQSAGLFAIMLNNQFTDDDACKLVDALKLFKIAYSWGGPESLAVVVSIPNERRATLCDAMGEPAGPIIRLSIGLEDEHDLWNDLHIALQTLG